MAAPRYAARRWRLLVHERIPGQKMSGMAHSIGSTEKLAGASGEWRKPLVLPGTEFDELVVSPWLHVEQMTTTSWWMNVAGIDINVVVDRYGKPRVVHIGEPDRETWPDCTYRYEGDE